MKSQMEKDNTFNISIGKINVDFKSENEVNNKYKSLKITNSIQMFISFILLSSIVLESKEKRHVFLYFAFLFNCLFNGLGFFLFINTMEKIPKLFHLKSSFAIYFLEIINYFVTSIVCLNEKEFWIIVERRMILNLLRMCILIEISLVVLLRLMLVYSLIKKIFLTESERKRINLFSNKDMKRFFSIFTILSYNVIFDSVYAAVVSVFVLKFTHLKFTFMDAYIGSIGGILLSSSIIGLVIGIILIINILIK
ncbi:hypothetical protein RS030_142157 [Cryptosporidium xiaoi]|uniref:Uncharacterized protein n=1 Tax=Cryptosporidium xiaoi TaxID=659607 RepID=A0AAV9Y369_9CRYT